MAIKSVRLKFCSAWSTTLCGFFSVTDSVTYASESHWSFKDASQIWVLHKTFFSVFFSLYHNAWNKSKSYFPATEGRMKGTHLLICVTLNWLINKLTSRLGLQLLLLIFTFPAFLMVVQIVTQLFITMPSFVSWEGLKLITQLSKWTQISYLAKCQLYRATFSKEHHTRYGCKLCVLPGSSRSRL